MSHYFKKGDRVIWHPIDAPEVEGVVTDDGAEVPRVKFSTFGRPVLVDRRTLRLVQPLFDPVKATIGKNIRRMKASLARADEYLAAAEARIHRNVLPTDAAARNAIPLADGCLDYFPNALAAVAALSKVANEQHNPGEPMHWARNKSTDHRNKIMKHLLDAGGIDSDNQRHSTKVAWRALANLEDELIAAGAVPGRNAIGSPGVLSNQQHNCIEDEI